MPTRPVSCLIFLDVTSRLLHFLEVGSLEREIMKRIIEDVQLHSYDTCKIILPAILNYD